MAFGSVTDSETFDFSNIAANRDQTLTLAPVVPIQDADEVSLVVRVEEEDISTDTSIEVSIYGTWPNDKENVTYRTPAALATVIMDSTTMARSILVALVDFAEGRPPALRVEIRGVQHITTAANLSVKISVGLQINAAR